MSLFSKLVGSVVGTVTTPVFDFMKLRVEERYKIRIRRMELQDALHQRQMELAKQGLTADMNWEQTFAEQAATSWKDEYTLLVVSIPAILAFIRTRGSTVRQSSRKGSSLSPKRPAGIR